MRWTRSTSTINPYAVMDITDDGNLALDVQVSEVVDGEVIPRKVSEIGAE